MQFLRNKRIRQGYQIILIQFWYVTSVNRIKALVLEKLNSTQSQIIGEGDCLSLRQCPDPGCLSRIPDPESQIRIFSSRIQGSCVLKNKMRNVHSGSQILALDFFPSRIPDPGVKMHRIRNTALRFVSVVQLGSTCL